MSTALRVAGCFARARDQPAHLPGQHSEYVLGTDDFCLPLPDDIDFETGAMFTDVLGTAIRAMKRIRVAGQDTVLITGRRYVVWHRQCSAGSWASVIAADTNEYHLGLANAAGVGATVNPGSGDMASRIREFAGTGGVDVAIDCSGSQDGRLECLEAVRRGVGRVPFVGLGQGLQLNAEEASRIFLKEVTLFGSWYSDPIDMEEIARLVRRGLDRSPMVTRRFGIDDAPEAFTVFFGGTAAKVVILPWQLLEGVHAGAGTTQAVRPPRRPGSPRRSRSSTCQMPETGRRWPFRLFARPAPRGHSV